MSIQLLTCCEVLGKASKHILNYKLLHRISNAANNLKNLMYSDKAFNITPNFEGARERNYEHYTRKMSLPPKKTQAPP